VFSVVSTDESSLSRN